MQPLVQTFDLLAELEAQVQAVWSSPSSHHPLTEQVGSLRLGFQKASGQVVSLDLSPNKEQGSYAIRLAAAPGPRVW